MVTISVDIDDGDWAGEHVTLGVRFCHSRDVRRMERLLYQQVRLRYRPLNRVPLREVRNRCRVLVYKLDGRDGWPGKATLVSEW